MALRTQCFTVLQVDGARVLTIDGGKQTVLKGTVILGSEAIFRGVCLGYFCISSYTSEPIGFTGFQNTPGETHEGNYKKCTISIELANYQNTYKLACRTVPGTNKTTCCKLFVEANYFMYTKNDTL